MPQNKFEVLKSRVMQCGIEKRAVRSMRIVVVKYFKCGEEGHKYRECPLGERKVKRVAHPKEGKAHQGERRLARPEKGKAQEKKWRRSSWEELRKRAEWYCGPTVPQDAELWELGWRGQGAVVTYLECSRCGEGGCYMENNQGQGVVPYWKREKISWCGCKGGKEQSSVTPYKRLGKISDILHLNNENNQLER